MMRKYLTMYRLGFQKIFSVLLAAAILGILFLFHGLKQDELGIRLIEPLMAIVAVIPLYLIFELQFLRLYDAVQIATRLTKSKYAITQVVHSILSSLLLTALLSIVCGIENITGQIKLDFIVIAQLLLMRFVFFFIVSVLLRILFIWFRNLHLVTICLLLFFVFDFFFGYVTNGDYLYESFRGIWIYPVFERNFSWNSMAFLTVQAFFAVGGLGISSMVRRREIW